MKHLDAIARFFLHDRSKAACRLTWTHSVLTVGVTVGLSALAGAATAHDTTLGSESTSNFTCDASADWDTIRSVTLSSFPHDHNCVITGAADLNNPGGNASDQTYHLTVSVDNLNPLLDNSAARTVELRDQSGVNDPNVWPVATTSRVVVQDGSSHTIRLQCRKNSGSAPNLTILDSSLNVTCLQQ
ncbi:MAG: hypothetical protein AB7I59_10610 [Geminicoccaceae bacterium]